MGVTVTNRVEYLTIPADDNEARSWVRPYLVRFEAQFALDTHDIEPVTDGLYQERVDREVEYGVDWFLDDKMRLWIMLIEGTPAGYCVVHHDHQHFARCLHVRAFYIDPPYRAAGRAKPFLQHVLTEERRVDPRIQRVSLNCLDGNTVAKRVYTGCGFKTFTSTMIKEFD